MMIYSIQNFIWTLYKIAESKIELYFIKIFTLMIISYNSFGLISGAVKCCHGNWHWRAEKRILNTDFMFVPPTVCVKNIVENVDWILLKLADLPYLAKIVLLIHSNCPQADIPHNSTNRFHAKQRTRTN